MIPFLQMQSAFINLKTPLLSKGITMTLVKNNIVEKIYLQTGFPRKKVSKIIDTLFDLIKRDLVSGEDVLISGFGKFCVKDKKVRKGRNPSTGDELYLDARRVITFKCSEKLRGRVNE